MKRLALIVGTLLLAGLAGAQNFSLAVAHTFCEQAVAGTCADGSGPVGDLIQASDGLVYGVTQGGGAHNAGSVFSIASSGAVATVYSFCAQAACADGEQPEAGVIEGTDGSLYGTTRLGGAAGMGSIYRLSRTGALHTLYSFCIQAGCADGQWPRSALVQDSHGNLYGVAEYGGDAGAGTLFQISAAGAFTRLYSFCALALCADGALPQSGLLLGAGGTLVGVTAGKGTGGTVFSRDAVGAFKTLHTFCAATNCPDGLAPTGRLAQAPDGSYYGVTQYGGAHGNSGTVFRIPPAGSFTSLSSFCGLAQCADGAIPRASLFAAGDGNLYGTTSGGGAANAGSVFRVNTGGVITTLDSLCAQSACADGFDSAGGVLQLNNGDLLTATLGGGAPYAGVLLYLHAAPALAAPVTLTASPTVANVGAGTTLTWSATNAFSAGAQVCEAFADGAPYASVPPSGSMQWIPTAAGSATFAITCGGTESAVLTLTVQK